MGILKVLVLFGVITAMLVFGAFVLIGLTALIDLITRVWRTR